MKRLFIILSYMLIAAACIKENPTGADLKPGDIIPGFVVKMNDGSVVSDQTLIGNVSFIMFFHTSCPDCQQALPVVQKIYDEYIEKGVSFAIISRDEYDEDIKDYWKKAGLKMPYSAQQSRLIYELFAQTRIPRIYINDENGVIRNIFTDDPVPDYDDLKTALDDLIR